MRQPVEVTFPDDSKALLLHYDTLNNPRPDRHGLDMQVWSYDDGLSWGNEMVLRYPPQNNSGAMVGPSVGVQSPRTGRLYFSAHLAFSYWASAQPQAPHIAFLYYSDDHGASWAASPSVQGLDECSIALLPPEADTAAEEEVPEESAAVVVEHVLMNCRVPRGEPRRAQVVWRVAGSPARGEATMLTRSGVVPKEKLLDPGCQVGSHLSLACLRPVPPTSLPGARL